MYQHFNTRKKLIQRIVTYCLMVLAVIVGVAGTTAWIMGYRLDFNEDQAVERITLLQFTSFPNNADIFVNDEKLNFTTPGRYDSARPGENTLKFQLEGYHNWQTKADLTPAEVYWFNYARMVPNKIESSNSLKVSSYYQASSAPNGSYILLHEAPQDRKFKIIDVSDPKNVRVNEIELPEGAVKAPVNEIKIIEWDSSSNFVLLNQDGNIIRLDRRDVNKSQNLSDLFGVSIKKSNFLNGDSNIVFGLTNNDLRRFDIKAKAVSAPLVTDVTSYDIYGDGKLSYVSQKEGKQTTGVYFKDNNYVINEYDDVQPTRVSFVNYYREDYFLSTRNNKINIVKNPFSSDNSETKEVDVPFEASRLFHNGSGRMILASRGNQIFTYDLEKELDYHFDLESFTKKPFWLDDFHLGYVHNNELKMVEFNGENRESLVLAYPFGVFSNNNEHLFTFRTTKKGTYLVDNMMIVKTN